MNWRTQGLTLALVGLGLCPLGADTITTKDHASVNGSLIKMANGEMTIVARYSSGEKPLRIKIEATEIIEFNGTTFNSGAPPKALGVGPPLNSESKTPPARPQNGTDTIILRGAQRKPCKLVGIDEQLVHCAGKDGDYNRRIVIRVLVEAQ
jgi:hypothetical protein